MKAKTDRAISRTQKPKYVEGEGLNWVIIAGGALLSRISFRLVCKLKQAVTAKFPASDSNALKGNKKCTSSSRSGPCPLHSNIYCFTQDEDGSYHCLSGISEGTVEMKQPPTSPRSKEMDMTLPLVTVPAPESNKENGMIWTLSSERLELPRKLFHQSNGSDSPCASESGSDIYSKREVIHKLRQQLKRRDEMILEMQAQITDLQNSLRDQMTQSTLLQSQLDSANRDLFESEREIQRLRKAIADHCVAETGSPEKPAVARNWQLQHRNGQVNGFHHSSRDLELQCVGTDNRRADLERIEMLKREVVELKGLIEAKEYLLQHCEEEELQLGMASQIPNIL